MNRDVANRRKGAARSAIITAALLAATSAQAWTTLFDMDGTPRFGETGHGTLSSLGKCPLVPDQAAHFPARSS